MSRHATHRTGHRARTRIVVGDPCGQANPALVAAASRAGGVGLLDLASAGDWPGLHAELQRRRTTSWWLRPDQAIGPQQLEGLEATTVVLTLPGGSVSNLEQRVATWAGAGHRVLVQVTSSAEARAAVTGGAQGLLASGREAGGRVGPTEAFMLLQQVVDLGVPVWLRGGIGPHTAAAAVVGGAAGVVVDVQAGLLRESALGPEARQALAAMDGTQTRVVGQHRVYTRPDLAAATVDLDPEQVAARLGADLREDLVPFGQDGALAARLAEQHVTVGGLVQALESAIEQHGRLASELLPLAPGAGPRPRVALRRPSGSA